MKHTITITVFALLLAFGSLAFSFDQLPPGKWWENDKVVKELELTDEQQDKIHDMVYQHAMGMIDLNATVRRSELELSTLVEQPDFKPNEVRRAFADFQKARQSLENSRFEMLLSVRTVLDTEQWQKLQNLRQKFEKNRNPRRGGDRPPMRPGNQRRPQRPPR